MNKALPVPNDSICCCLVQFEKLAFADCVNKFRRSITAKAFFSHVFAK